MKAIIIDDEPLARSMIQEFLKTHADIEIVAECGDGFEGVKNILQHKPELVFLDIQMPKLNGFEMLELLEEDLPGIIFTTAFDEYAIKAFETNAIDYLLKPFGQERFDKALEKFRNLEKSKAVLKSLDSGISAAYSGVETRIVVKSGGEIKIIPTSEVVYIESYDDYVKIHTSDSIHIKKKTMSYYESNLDGKIFARIHRSFLVNITHADKLVPQGNEGYLLILKNGETLNVSRNGYNRLKEIWGV